MPTERDEDAPGASEPESDEASGQEPPRGPGSAPTAEHRNAPDPVTAADEAPALDDDAPAAVQTAGTAAESDGHPVRRHHALVRITHWLNALLLLGMIGSGLQIYGAFPHFGIRGEPYLPNPLDGQTLPRPLRLGGWLAGGINWHFALAWPFVATGLLYLAFLVASGEWRSLLFRPRDVPRAVRMQLYYLRLRRQHPPQGKHNALQKLAYSGIVLLGVLSVLSGFAIYKPVQLSWLVWLFGGFELARYWHFWAVWLFVAFTLVHVAMVLLVDPASLRAMITGWYRGRFPSRGA